MISPQAVLNCPMDPDANDAGADTVREYLTRLLLTVWVEGEDFSGKRPFGNSSWEGELHNALVKAELVTGTFNEWDELDDFDRPASDALIRAAIESLAAPVRPGDVINAAERELTAARQLQAMTAKSHAEYVAGKEAALRSARLLQEPGWAE